MKTSEILQSVLAVGKYLESNPPKPITNADRIRQMTDEELADRIMANIRCDACKEVFHVECDVLKTCRGLWLDWLKQEAEE